MSLFAKKICPGCGKEIQGRKDKNEIYSNQFNNYKKFYVCADCWNKVHFAHHSFVRSYYEKNEFRTYIEWENQYRELFKEKFHCDYKYLSLEVDARHALLKVENVIYHFAQLQQAKFVINEVKENKAFKNATVKGKLGLNLECHTPAYGNNAIIIDHSFKFKGHKDSVFGGEYEYDLPEDLLQVEAMIQYLLYNYNLVEEPLIGGSDAPEQNAQEVSELSKAMALFMIDSLDNVTEESLKSQRNILIKAFHPDNSDVEASYAQKINDAYSLLSAEIAK